MNMTFPPNSRLRQAGRLLFIHLIIGLPLLAAAHPSPNTLIFLDIGPKKVGMEVQLPLPELELSFQPAISKDPEKLLARWEPQLREYLLAHIHAYVVRDKPWTVTINHLTLTHGQYPDSEVSYWEAVASVSLTPSPGDDTRRFYLDYDAILHQVVNHAALVSIRSDWENGQIDNNHANVQAIAWNLQNNVVPPLQVQLQRGSWWTASLSMIKLGIRHIADGTDHLMFLLVLLLPAMLRVTNGRWSDFGGTRYSLLRLLGIVTAFTIGHSLTLLLGAVGWVRLPAQPVEALIAVSILVSAAHAIRPLFAGKEKWVAAGFGLVHGLAFASTLSALQLYTGPMVLSILGFNIGIELMQLFVVAITVPWLLLLSKGPVYRYVRIAGAILAALAAVTWIVQRTIQSDQSLFTWVDQLTAYGPWVVATIALLAVVEVLRSRWPGQRHSYLFRS